MRKKAATFAPVHSWTLTNGEAMIQRPVPKYAYRVDEACAALGIGRTALYALSKSGELKLIRIAGRTLVPRSELERLTRVGEAA